MFVGNECQNVDLGTNPAWPPTYDLFKFMVDELKFSFSQYLIDKISVYIFL